MYTKTTTTVVHTYGNIGVFSPGVDRSHFGNQNPAGGMCCREGLSFFVKRFYPGEKNSDVFGASTFSAHDVQLHLTVGVSGEDTCSQNESTLPTQYRRAYFCSIFLPLSVSRCQKKRAKVGGEQSDPVHSPRENAWENWHFGGKSKNSPPPPKERSPLGKTKELMPPVRRGKGAGALPGKLRRLRFTEKR